MDDENFGYVLDLEEDSDRDVESSDDEINIFLHGTPEQKRRIRRKSMGEVSSSEDEFEKEMADELNETMKEIQEKQKEINKESCNENRGTNQSTSGCSAKDAPLFYDGDYFDSDSDEEQSSTEKMKKKHPVLSNDDLLYDPNDDDENQRWVDQQRRNHMPKSKDKTNKSRRPPNSDAVLDCPACMTTLCLDCQRHEKYHHQYRAMFVMNCNIEVAERLKFPKQSRKQNRKRKHDQKNNSGENTGLNASNETGHSEEELYHPVRCTECNTEVGVYDKDEIYHFFNVLASYA